MDRQSIVPFGKTPNADFREFNVDQSGSLLVSGVTGAASTGNRATATGGGAATITYAAATGVRHVIDALVWSYDSAPTGGRLTVEDGSGTVVLDIDITAAGPGAIPAPLMGTTNTAMIVKLFGGGGSVGAKINVLGKRTA